MTMTWGIVTDENGVDFHALYDNLQPEDNTNAFVFVDKESGFGFGEGVTLAKGLKKLPDGKFGA